MCCRGCGYDLRKLDNAGNEIWTRQFGTELRDEPSDVEVDDQGNIYVAGITRLALPGQRKIGNEDVYLRKYDSDGNELWTRQFGTTGTDQITNIALDGMGHIYVVGPTSGEFPGQTGSGKYDAYLRKFDLDGNAIWTRQFGTVDTETAVDVAADGEGRIYAVGFVRIGNPGQRIGVVQNSLTHSFDGDGNKIWSREFGTSEEDFATNVAVDAAGDIYVVGRTDGAFPNQVNFGGEDIFVRKFGPGGDEIWTYQFGSSAGDDVRDILLDGAGNLYLVGRTKGALAGQEHLGLSDAFLIKLSTGFSPPPAPEGIPIQAGSCSGLVTQIKGSLSIGWMLLGLMLPALTLARFVSRSGSGKPVP
ncbi:MAG: SBBP repeat-containing protein [Planctomycetes bacterium]|nr:SBBP repeat-containing protein [Planctomycetota bacterium]